MFKTRNKKSNTKCLIEIIKYYRSMGFFSEQKNLSDEELSEEIRKFIEAKYKIDVESYSKKVRLRNYLETAILSFDTEKISQEKFIQDISNRNVKWRFLNLLILVFTTIDFSYIFYKILNSLCMEFNSASNATIYFNLNNKFYWLLISIVVGSICGGYISKFLMYSILQEKVKDYNMYLALFNLNRPNRSKNIKYISIFTIAVSFIFIVLGLN